jgi:hypothetical protein
VLFEGWEGGNEKGKSTFRGMNLFIIMNVVMVTGM